MAFSGWLFRSRIPICSEDILMSNFSKWKCLQVTLKKNVSTQRLQIFKSQLMGVPIFRKLLWCDERRQQAQPWGSHSLTLAWPLLIQRPLPCLCIKLLELIHMQSAHWLWLNCVPREAFKATQQEEKSGQGLQSTCGCLQSSAWNVVFEPQFFVCLFVFSLGIFF